MVCGFKQVMNGEPTFFPERIWAKHGYNLNNSHTVALYYSKFPEMFDNRIAFLKENMRFQPKIHTIRSGDRFKAGHKLHMAVKVRTKQYFQINRDMPELEVVKSTQKIEIKWHYPEVLNPFCIVKIDGKEGLVFSPHKMAMNDGFPTLAKALQWFNKDFEGQIIHFTDFRYE